LEIITQECVGSVAFWSIVEGKENNLKKKTLASRSLWWSTKKKEKIND
jgi:hypothetical protein